MKAGKQLEDAVFYTAMSMAGPEERKLFLDQACGGNAELRAAVEALLAAEEQAESFFARGRSALTLEAAEVSQVVRTEGTADAAAVDEQIGARIGRYKVLQRIGEGGGGVVYMAEQQEPVRRMVAVKIIKPGMDTKNVIARFDAERQALAMMDHLNIARVLDAGATEAGRPYFVMELVRGVKITEYCDQNNLSTRERLELFVLICQAIQHAHQKGIIHRDIKPSNILITRHDGVAVPKVIDFGIAKAIAGRLTEQTQFTAYEQLIGTPAYMSPEQAELSGLDVDTRSDIYSLGVLLYELLTGRTPFDGQELMRSGLEEMRRTLREQEPCRLSTILTTLQGTELRATTAHRHVELPKLISLLKGDLDWVVMKALEKDRTRRYETANGFAMDVRRYLNNEPVLARPPSRRYRLQKLVRRNRGVFAAVAAAAMPLCRGWIFQPASQANAAAESGNKSTISAAVIMVVRMGVVRWAARNAEAGPGCWRCYSLRKSLRNMVSAIMGGATSAPSWLGRIQSFPPRRRGAGGWHRRPAVGRRFPTARAGWPARLKNARAPRHSGDGSGQALIDVLWNVAEGQRFTHGTMPAFCKEGGLVAGIKNWNQERRKSDDS